MRKIVLSIFIIACMFAFGAAVKTKAGTDDSARGWIWGGSDDGNMTGAGIIPTGVGWISMNCIDRESETSKTCVGEVTDSSLQLWDYGVNIPDGNGNLSGYGWSENLGWISFQDSAGCLSGGDCNARRDGNNLKGWARIMSISQAGINAGGWQGWISLNSENCDSDGNGWLDVACGGTNDNLSGAVSDYGVSIDGNTDKLSGFAWSDELGWLDFENVSIGPTESPTPPVPVTYSCVPGTPTLDCAKPENCLKKETVSEVCLGTDGSVGSNTDCGGSCSEIDYECDNSACIITPGQWKEVQP